FVTVALHGARDDPRREGGSNSVTTVQQQPPMVRVAVPTRAAPPPRLPTESRKPALRAKDFQFFYGQKPALKNITLDISELSVTAIIGPSGCGKSTFLRSFNRMNDLIPGVRMEGEMEAAGMDVLSSSTDVVELRRRVGMVFQRANPFPKSIFENVAFGLRMLGL